MRIAVRLSLISGRVTLSAGHLLPKIGRSQQSRFRSRTSARPPPQYRRRATDAESKNVTAAASSAPVASLVAVATLTTAVRPTAWVTVTFASRATLAADGMSAVAIAATFAAQARLLVGAYGIRLATALLTAVAQLFFI